MIKPFKQAIQALRNSSSDALETIYANRLEALVGNLLPNDVFELIINMLKLVADLNTFNRLEASSGESQDVLILRQKLSELSELSGELVKKYAGQENIAWEIIEHTNSLYIHSEIEDVFTCAMFFDRNNLEDDILAAREGDAHAQYEIGKSYSKIDAWQFPYWNYKAANGGYIPAMFELGTCYKCGFGINVNEVQAAYWFHEAADEGYIPAQYELGVCYREGIGVAKDEEQAAYWFRVADMDDDE